MAKKEVLNLEVKSNIKSVTKDQKDWNTELDKTEKNLQGVNEEGKETIAEMQILGISLNGVKAAFNKIVPAAKVMFGTIKAGMLLGLLKLKKVLKYCLLSLRVLGLPLMLYLIELLSLEVVLLRYFQEM